jgi:hypothetical protein
MGGKRKPIDFSVDDNGCFNCTSHAKIKGGYHRIKINYKSEMVHRYVFEQCFGFIPDDLLVRHKCDNRCCINIEHLEHGTRQDNVNDMLIRNRQNSELTEKEVLEIITLHKDKKYSDIAKIYNVNEVTIRYIFNGLTWGHITGFNLNDYKQRYIKNEMQSNNKFIVWENKNNCWRVLICGSNKFRKHVGRYKDLNQAIIERDKALLELSVVQNL